jgi:hypothetical protein
MLNTILGVSRELHAQAHTLRKYDGNDLDLDLV